MDKPTRILIIGACGQIGTDLVVELRKIYGTTNVVASDIAEPKATLLDGPFENLNIMDSDRLYEIVKKYEITEIYHLAAILSAKGEQNPKMAWDINMTSLLSILDIAKEESIKVYWPSSIAVFGPNTPMDNTPQDTVMQPNTVYGISKLAGEMWCQYYHEKYGVDVRSIRYPGLISHGSLPGGGTTDYAVDIFYKAIEGNEYDCFLSEDTYLPMMYMSDAVRATIELMRAPAEKIKVRTSYNLAGMSFSPKEIYEEIKKHYPEFKIKYSPDFRQAIADSWPSSIDDSVAKEHWGWNEKFDLAAMTDDMLYQLKKKIKITV
ncbi:NAD-dependent epimerase/dehydratase family protein [Sediminitomix flava]|uniref:Nucleoside-diphosphate-sugar epimerase n=1 Tax=Sediminitomix flava TaxID=379075 RepID=A0A315Z9T5_SEDFL|nr:NAD-dependent epimerase/dehydratase family protein [Sediminitomix flava]PWJ42100.1 nucleoside-diphosphate-sugar epimerase [Sediminitomix flava]